MSTPINSVPARTIESPLADGVWSVDPQLSEIGFAVKAMWGLQTVRGVFGAYHGTLRVRAGSVAGELTIDAQSIDTGNRRRDRHLRSSDFFDVERHGQILFTGAAIPASAEGLVATGELAIGSSRVPVEIPVDIEELPDGSLRLEGVTTISRRAAGLTWNMLGTIGRDATVHAQLTLNRATAQSSSDGVTPSR